MEMEVGVRRGGLFSIPAVGVEVWWCHDPIQRAPFSEDTLLELLQTVARSETHP